jgi:hypothetical protein
MMLALKVFSTPDIEITLPAALPMIGERTSPNLVGVPPNSLILRRCYPHVAVQYKRYVRKLYFHNYPQMFYFEP